MIGSSTFTACSFHKKEEKIRPLCGAAVWRPAAMLWQIFFHGEAFAKITKAKSHKMATVQLKNIKKIYDNKVTAVHDFNLDIADKEFIVLVGPSGCGKSTTLRMVAGLEEISDGELYIGDKLVNDVPPKDRDIAMVFQNYALYPHMTVYENMAFGLKLRKTPKDEIDKRVKEAAKILDITQYLDRKPKALSGGQRQRVAIGRAIVREPSVFLMDEPLSNLDAKLRNQMRAEIIKLRQRVNTTFIYVTHDQTEAMTLGDRIVIMKDGFIQQIGTPREVFSHPANLFVAGFIGSPQMNFIDARLSDDNGRYYVEAGSARIELTDEQQSCLKGKNAAPSDIILGIRPENIRIAEEKAENTLTGKLSVSEMMGSSVHLHIILNGKEMVVIEPLADQSADLSKTYKFDSDITIALDGRMCHLFSRETEENLI